MIRREAWQPSLDRQDRLGADGVADRARGMKHWFLEGR